MPKSFTTLEIRSKFVDIGLASFVSGIVCWEGDHVRLILTHKDSKGLTKALVSEVSSCLRKMGVDVFWMSRLEINAGLSF